MHFVRGGESSSPLTPARRPSHNKSPTAPLPVGPRARGLPTPPKPPPHAASSPWSIFPHTPAPVDAHATTPSAPRAGVRCSPTPPATHAAPSMPPRARTTPARAPSHQLRRALATRAPRPAIRPAGETAAPSEAKTPATSRDHSPHPPARVLRARTNARSCPSDKTSRLLATGPRSTPRWLVVGRDRSVRRQD